MSSKFTLQIIGIGYFNILLISISFSLVPYLPHCINTQVEYMGGDKEAAKCKEVESDEVVAYKDALKDLVTAVSVVHSLGKSLEDFGP